MKTKTKAPVIAAAAAAVHGAAAQSWTYGDPLTAPEERGLLLLPEEDGVDTVIFDECLGKSLPACRALIKGAVRENPGIFEFRESEVEFNGIPVRTEVDEGYNKVFIRTDLAGTHAVGTLGDGMIFYPFPWKLSPTESATLGPWDCQPGDEFLTYEQCCDLVIDGVAPDMNGNALTCEASYPIGSVQNPREDTRVIIHVNDENRVVHPPRLE